MAFSQKHSRGWEVLLRGVDAFIPLV